MTINGDEISTVNAFCDEKLIESSKIDQNERDFYRQLYITLQGIRSLDSLIQLGYSSKYFKRDRYDRDANLLISIDYNRELRHLFAKTEIITFNSPFDVNGKTKIIINGLLMAMIQADGIIRVKPIQCLNESSKMQLLHLINFKKRFEPQESSSSNNSGDNQLLEDQQSNPDSPMYHADRSDDANEYEDQDNNNNGNSDRIQSASASSSEFNSAIDTLFRDIFGLIGEDQELARAEVTLQKLYDLVVSNRQNFTQNDDYQAELMLKAAQIDSSKCNEDKFRLWNDWLSNEDYMNLRSNLRPFLIHFAREQMLTCVEVLNGSIKLKVNSISIQSRRFLRDFMVQLNKEINQEHLTDDDYNSTIGNDNDNSLPLTRNLTQKSIYKTLIVFIKSSQQNVNAQMRRVSNIEEQKYLLIDTIDSTLAQWCNEILQIISVDLEYYQFLRSNQWSVVGFDISVELSDDVIELLQITRICQAINPKQLDQNRLLTAYEHRSGFSRNISPTEF